MKKSRILALAMAVVICMTGCGSDSTDTKTETKELTITEAATEEIKQELPFNITISNNYRNDTTGNWRKASYAETAYVMEDYAVDYYKIYFGSNDEIHFVWNASLGTVTQITYVLGELEVATFEYVSGEEHDANKACSGMMLKDVMINIETGEVEEL